MRRSPEEVESFITEIQAKAETAVAELLKSDDWTAWLKWQSHFWRYSFANQVLIYCQNPEATMVNSFKRWQELGRMVRKGEKSIRIWAPMNVKTNMIEVSTSADGEETETPIKRTAFRLVPVFDISQTEGDTMPPAFPAKGELTLDNPALFDDYVTLWEALESTKGIDIDFEPMPDNTGGYYRRPTSIRLNENNPNLANRFRVLLHEAAHFLGEHKQNQNPHDKEIQAELSCYIAAQAIGYDLGDASIGYLASWADDEKTLKANANAVQSIAKALIELFPLPKVDTSEQPGGGPSVETPTPQEPNKQLVSNGAVLVTYDPNPWRPSPIEKEIVAPEPAHALAPRISSVNTPQQAVLITNRNDDSRTVIMPMVIGAS